MPIMESEHSSMIKSDKDCPSIANNISNNNNNNDTLSGHKSLHLSSSTSTTTNMVSSMIKHEVVDSGFENKCVMISSKSHNSQVPTAADCASLATTLVSSASSNMNMTASSTNLASTASSNNNNNSSPKMGSRRIFTPQFKLQVLESYRNDNDCKGNQRATARKYNIHRRQIQKWLQCESNLRSSVANINQSNVKHQFHNISHQHQPQQHQQQQLQMPIAAATNSNSHFSHHHHHQQQQQQQQLLHNQHLLHHHHHHQQQQQQLSLDTARQSVALNSITVPSLPAGVASTSAAAASAQGVLAAANLAAVVAAAAAAGAAGAMAIANNTSSSGTNTNTCSSTQQQQTVVSPLRPTAIGGSTGATLSPSMLHPHHQPQRHQHHHHHLYPMPYTHTPASVPVSVPILTHHIPPQHLHHHYQYHNLSPHAHALPQTQQQSQQPLAFMPSACLPVTVLSATTTAASNAPTQGDAQVEGAENRTSDELRESSTTKPTTTTLAATGATLTGNSYMHGVEYVYKCTENGGGGGEPNEAKYKGLPIYSYMLQQQQTSLAVSPMDLSVGPRRENREHFVHVDLRSSCKSNDDGVAKRSDNLSKGVVNNNNDVVDLTFRKRKVIATANALPEIDDDEQPEKLAKFNAADIKADSSESESLIKVEVAETENSEDDVEVEVEEKSPPSKPVKLFKPYLLDGDNDDEDHSAEHSEDKPLSMKSAGLNNSESLRSNEQREPIIWSNHPGCLSPHSYDSRQNSSRDSNFQSPSVEKYTFPIGSPYFHGSKSSPSPQSALSPTASAPAMSPASFRCPKGSPVSGYESSSSTYSESSSRSEHESSFNRTYSLDLQMHRVYHDHLMMPTQPQQNHVQRWLDQDTSTNMNSTPPAANDASIYMLKILQ